MLFCIILFLPVSHTSSGHLDTFLHTVIIVFIIALCVPSLVINWRCQKGSNGDVTINVTKEYSYENLNG